MGKNKYTKIFVKQYGEFTCGLACLSMIVKYYGGDIRQEDLRYISGTTLQGTSLLGLYYAARNLQLNAECYEADIDSLKTVNSPTILHVVKNNNIEHYVVCFRFIEGYFLIGDPEDGIIKMKDHELTEIWKTRALLMLEPSDDFVKKKSDRKNKNAWLKKMLENDIPILSTAFFLGVIISLIGLSTAIYSQKLIDDLIPSKDYTKLILASVLFVLLLIFGGCLNYLRNIFVVKQIRNFNNRITQDFFSKILYLPKPFFDSVKTGEIIARMNDTRRIQETITYLVSEVLINVLILMFSVMYLFFYSWKMAFIASTCIPLFILLIVIYNKKIIKSQKSIMKSYAFTEALFIDTLQGMDEVKMTNKQKYFLKNINICYGKYQECIFKLGVLSAKYGFFSHIISITTMISIIMIGIYSVVNDQLKIGELMAIITISNMLISSTALLSKVNLRFQEAGVAFSRLYEFFKVQPEFEKENQELVKNIDDEFKLTVNQLTFRFIGHPRLFKNITMEIQKGELVTLYGEVGSGKSTLIQILQRYYKIESGEIRVNGDLLESFSIPEWRNIIGVVHQRYKIFSGTVGDNICLDNFENEKKTVMDFCKSYGFNYFINKLPQGLYTIVGDEGVNISGGQQQIILLMRALYRNPKILLLDEPTSSMDSKTEKIVLDILLKNKFNFAILLVTHKTHIAKLSDKIYCLENGVVKDTGRFFKDI